MTWLLNGGRLEVTLFWYRPHCFCCVNQVVLMLTRCIYITKAESSSTRELKNGLLFMQYKTQPTLQTQPTAGKFPSETHCIRHLYLNFSSFLFGLRIYSAWSYLVFYLTEYRGDYNIVVEHTAEPASDCEKFIQELKNTKRQITTKTMQTHIVCYQRVCSTTRWNTEYSTLQEQVWSKERLKDEIQ